MARKSNGKNGIAKIPVVTPGDYLDDEGHLLLKGDLFWKWRATDSDYQRLQMELKQVRTSIQEEIAKNPALKALHERNIQLAGEVSVALSEVQAVQKEIEEKLNISLKDCAIDDKTGRIYVLSDDGAKTPKMSGSAKRSRKRRVAQS